MTSWYGMCAPAATPVTILDKLHADLTKTLQAPDVQQRLRSTTQRVLEVRRFGHGGIVPGTAE